MGNPVASGIDIISNKRTVTSGLLYEISSQVVMVQRSLSVRSLFYPLCFSIINVFTLNCAIEYLDKLVVSVIEISVFAISSYITIVIIAVGLCISFISNSIQPVFA